MIKKYVSHTQSEIIGGMMVEYGRTKEAPQPKSWMNICGRPTGTGYGWDMTAFPTITMQ